MKQRTSGSSHLQPPAQPAAPYTHMEMSVVVLLMCSCYLESRGAERGRPVVKPLQTNECL